MGEDDLSTLFYSEKYSHTPTKDEMVGRWEGMLVSDSFVSPRSQIFDFEYDGSGEYQMHYNFTSLIGGYSDISANKDLFRFDDFTPFHDELRMIRSDLVVGKWVTNWSLLPSNQFSINELQNMINSGASQFQVLDSIYKIFNLRIPRIPQEIGLSFLNVDNHPQKGSRIGLGYILKKNKLIILRKSKIVFISIQLLCLIYYDKLVGKKQIHLQINYQGNHLYLYHRRNLQDLEDIDLCH